MYQEINLTYPDGYNREILHNITCWLFNKYSWKVGDGEETISLLNFALGKAILTYRAENKHGVHAKFETYYIKLAENAIFTEIKKRNARKQLRDTDSIDLLEEEAIRGYRYLEPDSDDYQVEADKLDLSYLTEQERGLLDMYYFQGISTNRIAATLQTSSSGVNRSIRRAVQSIRSHYQSRGFTVSNDDRAIIQDAPKPKWANRDNARHEFFAERKQLILETLRANGQGMTVAEIMEATGLINRVVGYHLCNLKRRNHVVNDNGIFKLTAKP